MVQGFRISIGLVKGYRVIQWYRGITVVPGYCRASCRTEVHGNRCSTIVEESYRTTSVQE